MRKIIGLLLVAFLFCGCITIPYKKEIVKEIRPRPIKMYFYKYYQYEGNEKATAVYDYILQYSLDFLKNQKRYDAKYEGEIPSEYGHKMYRRGDVFKPNILSYEGVFAFLKEHFAAENKTYDDGLVLALFVPFLGYPVYYSTVSLHGSSSGVLPYDIDLSRSAYRKYYYGWGIGGIGIGYILFDPNIQKVVSMQLCFPGYKENWYERKRNDKKSFFLAPTQRWEWSFAEGQTEFLNRALATLLEKLPNIRE